MSLTDLQDMKPKMNHLQSLKKVDIEDIRENVHNIFAQRDIEELKENIKKRWFIKTIGSLPGRRSIYLDWGSS